MGSEDDHPVYGVDEFDDDDEVEDLEDDDDTSSSDLAAAADDVTVAAPAPNLVTVADPNHQFAIIPARKPPIDDSRRVLFQRLWTDEDEMELLRGFLEYTSHRGGAHFSSHHHDTAAFYDQIRSKLQLDFNKSQLVEKIRRLKKKYRTIMGKIESGKDYVFKSTHDQATFEISKKIWYEPAPTRVIDVDEEINPTANFNSFNHNYNGGVDLNSKGSGARPKKRSKAVKSEELPQTNQPTATPVGNLVPGLIEETVKSCLTPILKELVDSVTNNSKGGFVGIGGMGPMGLNFGGPSPLGCLGGGDVANAMSERWRKQQILELEVYSKRLELVQDQIKSAMEELTKRS